jgi:spermidine synthase
MQTVGKEVIESLQSTLNLTKASFLQGFSTDSILFNEKTEFQSIVVFRSAQHGNVLVLDGVVRKCICSSCIQHFVILPLRI